MKQRIHGEVSVWIRSPPFEITILEYNDISDTLSFLLNVTSNDEVPTLLSVVLNFHFEQQQIKIILNSVWISDETKTCLQSQLDQHPHWSLYRIKAAILSQISIQKEHPFLTKESRMKACQERVMHKIQSYPNGAALQTLLWHFSTCKTTHDKKINSVPVLESFEWSTLHTLWKTRSNIYSQHVWNAVDSLLNQSSRQLRLMEKKNQDNTISDQYALQKPTWVFKIEQPNDPEFDRLVKEHGMKYGFHGSSIHHFHSILQNGLQNYSDTKYMKTGAAFGNGVYLSADIQVAFNFMSRKSIKWKDCPLLSTDNNNENQDYSLGCIAVCQVIAYPHHVSRSGNGNPKSDYYIVPKAHHVKLHSLLCYLEKKQKVVRLKIYPSFTAMVVLTVAVIVMIVSKYYVL